MQSHVQAKCKSKHSLIVCTSQVQIKAKCKAKCKPSANQCQVKSQNTLAQFAHCTLYTILHFYSLVYIALKNQKPCCCICVLISMFIKSSKAKCEQCKYVNHHNQVLSDDVGVQCSAFLSFPNSCFSIGPPSKPTKDESIKDVLHLCAAIF